MVSFWFSSFFFRTRITFTCLVFMSDNGSPGSDNGSGSGGDSGSSPSGSPGGPRVISQVVITIPKVMYKKMRYLLLHYVIM